MARESLLAMRRPVRSLSVLIWMLVCCLSGCADPEEALERAAIRGRVTMDGKPIKAAAIVFKGPVLADGSDGGALESDRTIVVYGTIEDGAYSLDLENGPPVGTVAVEVRPKPLSREEFEAKLDANKQSRRQVSLNIVDIPSHYSGDSPLRAVIESGVANEVNFELELRP